MFSSSVTFKFLIMFRVFILTLAKLCTWYTSWFAATAIESRVYLLHSHTTTFSKSGGATCFTPVTDWGMLSIISHPHDEMSMVGGLSFRAAFQISTCKWHLNKCWINASSVGGRIFMLGVGFSANEILMAKKFHGL